MDSRTSEDLCDTQGVTIRAEGLTLHDDLDETYAKILLSIDKDDVEYASAVSQWLAYSNILKFDDSDFDLQETSTDFPPAHYAALLWAEYITLNPEPKTFLLLTKLFRDKNEMAYRNWLRLVYHHSNEYSNNHRSSVVFHLMGRTDEGYTCYAQPLIWGSGLGLISMVRHLLITDPSINVNEPGVANVSALAIATHQQHHEIMELLLSYGGDISNSHEEEDSRPCEVLRSPLYNAARFGHFKALEILLRERSRFGRPGWILEVALVQAADRRADGAIDCVRQLIDAGVNVNAPSRVSGDMSSDKSSCALDAACQRGRGNIVHVLLDAGADPNLHVGEHGFPLQAAAYWGSADIVQILLDAGADPRARSGPYGTALIAASFRGFADSASMLLAAGADTTVQWNLRSVLHEFNVRVYEPGKECDVEDWHRRFEYPYDEYIERDIENVNLTTRARRPPDDDIFGGEWELWLRIKALAMQIGGHRVSTSWQDAEKRKMLVVCFGTLMNIRVAGRRIARKLRLAGMAVDQRQRYMFTAMQAALAAEWKEVVDVLRESGMPVPKGVGNGETEQEEEVLAEAMARLLRVRRSYQYEMRTREGRSMGGGSSMTP
ncbi:hypothetical protein MMC18_005183 [Xylographa bjoerkii]|nr:hypothetical protein [Xylographa bjoerkii]